ncbi:hypothetical protein AALA82_12985 [Oscillospiraceae bacterium 50-16]
MKFSEYDLVELLEETDGIPRGRGGLVVKVHDQPESYEVEVLGVNGASSPLLTLPPEALQLVRRSGMGAGVRRPVRRKLEKGEAVLAARFLLELGKLVFRGRLPTGQEAKACLRAYRLRGGKLTLWREAGGWGLSSSFPDQEGLERAAEQLEEFFCWLQGTPRSGQPWVGRHSFSPRELPWENVQLKQRPGDRAAEIAVQGADAIREYRAFYRLPCAGFSEKELDAWARGRWNWGTRPDAPQVWRGEEILFGALLSGIGLERGAVSWAGVYELLHRLNLPVRGRPERFTALGADGMEYAFSYDFFREVSIGHRTSRVWYFLRDGERIEGRQKFSWWERGPVLPLWESRNIRKDERRFTWTPVITALTGLRFERPKQ